MGLTNFPNGVASFGMPVLGTSEETITTGNVFFVDSGTGVDESRLGRSPSQPYATIDYAIGQCTANNGDIIFVMPGHAESPTAAITMDVAGVWVRGLGWGNDRPTVTSSNATNFVAMSAASCRISNIIFVLGVATSTHCINVTGDACIVEGCETRIHATSQFTNLITVTDAEHVIIRNNRLFTLITASSTSGLNIDGSDQIQIYGNTVYGHFGEHALDNTTAASVDECLLAVIRDNIIRNISDTGMAIDMDDNATGILAGNYVGTALDFEVGFDSGNMYCYENYMVDAVDVGGAIIPSALAAS